MPTVTEAAGDPSEEARAHDIAGYMTEWETPIRIALSDAACVEADRTPALTLVGLGIDVSGKTFPVCDVLAKFAQPQGTGIVACESADSLRAVGLAFRTRPESGRSCWLET